MKTVLPDFLRRIIWAYVAAAAAWRMYPDEVTVVPNDGHARIQDADFIAHARTDVPALVAEVRRLQEQLERTKPPLGYRHKTVCLFCDKQHGHYDECAEKFADLRKEMS